MYSILYLQPESLRLGLLVERGQQASRQESREIQARATGTWISNDARHVHCAHAQWYYLTVVWTLVGFNDLRMLERTSADM